MHPHRDTSIQAECQLDLKPLLVSIAERLDQIESWTMWTTAQMAGYSPAESNDVGVERDTEFQLEDEATRIARITKEFLEAIALPEAVKKRIALRWLEAARVVELDGEAGRALREALEAQDEGEERLKAA